MADQGAGAGLLERITGRAQSAAHSLRVRSALNPMLWLCGIVSLPCLVLAYIALGVEPFSTIVMIAGIAPIVVTMLGFLYFMIFKPERLQSEDYQIRHETLELIKEKGSPIELSPSSLDVITNPFRPLLPRKGR